MEFIRENIHMNILTAQGQSQITLEDDMNLSDARPDMEKVILEEGTVEIAEVKAMKDAALIRGTLMVKVLYITDDRACVVDKMEGSISFEEEMTMIGVDVGDNVSVESEVTDLSVGLINSRKISIRSLLTLSGKVHKLQDVEIMNRIEGEGEIECLSKEQYVSQLVVCKKDIVRHKQEIELGNNQPDILQVLWQDMHLTRFETRCEDGKVLVNGEAELHVLYEGEGEEQPIEYFEKKVAFHEVLEERSASDHMISDICLTKDCMQLEIKPDFDGRERIFMMDLSLYLDIALYEKIKMDMVTDVYGVSKDICMQTKESIFPDVIRSGDATTTIEGELKIRGSHKKLMQVLGSTSSVCVQQVTIQTNKVEISGFTTCKCLYVTSDDMSPYDVVGTKIPFSYEVDVDGIEENDCVRVQTVGTSSSVSVTGDDTVKARVNMQFSVCVIRNDKRELLSQLEVVPMDEARCHEIPQYCIYRTMLEDTLWDIGKKYCVPTSQIKELNHLQTETFEEGQNLLIVR